MAKVGRPMKWETPELMQVEIDSYFDNTPMENWTITGLALALDTDRVTLINYQNRDDFFNTIRRAKLLVENSYELSLKHKGGIGDIFALKNFGWRDKQEIEANVNTVALDTLLDQFTDDTDKED